MSLAEIIKNQKFYMKLEEKKKNGTFSNSVMFFCDDEKTNELVLVLTSLMLNYQTYQLFDENSNEYQKIIKDADLDIKFYPKNREKLLVSDSNEIVEETYIKPVNLENKIFIIKDIDNSTEQAQNKLLKVLEEPPKNVYFLISCRSSDKVLPTIKSRCDKIFVEKLSPEELEKIFLNPLAVILSEGYIGRAEELSNKKNLVEIVDFAVDLASKLKNSSQVLKFSKEFVSFEKDIELILKIYSYCLEDFVKIKSEKEEMCVLKPYLQILKSVENEFSVQAICEIENLVSRFMEKMKFNANLNLSIDNLLLKILEVKYLCK